MKRMFKIITVLTALAISLNANAFKRDFISEEIIPSDKLSSFHIDENSSTYEKYHYLLSVFTNGLYSGDQEMTDRGKKGLEQIANEKEYGPAMFALGYNLKFKSIEDCAYKVACLTAPNKEAIYWLERAEKLDVTGSVAFELADYWFMLGDNGATESFRWSAIGKEKKDAYYNHGNR